VVSDRAPERSGVWAHKGPAYAKTAINRAASAGKGLGADRCHSLWRYSAPGGKKNKVEKEWHNILSSRAVVTENALVHKAGKDGETCNGAKKPCRKVDRP
jgi:hypothetical protein